MIKIYITAVDSRPNGSAVTLLEDYCLNFRDKDHVINPVWGQPELSQQIFNRLEEVEKNNDKISTPF